MVRVAVALGLALAGAGSAAASDTLPPEFGRWLSEEVAHIIATEELPRRSLPRCDTFFSC